MTSRWLQMFIRSRPMSSRTKTKTLVTHPEWYVTDEPVAQDEPPFPERWDVVNDQMATLIGLQRELIQAVAYHGSKHTPPKLPEIHRPTTGIRALQKQYDQMADNRATFARMRDQAVASGEVAPPPEEA